MTEDQQAELLDLYADNSLPAGLRAYVEEYLQSDPDAAQDAESLRATVSRLQAVPSDRPESWFVERLLDRLLRDSAEALSLPALGHNRNY